VTVLTPQTGDITRPVPGPWSEPYWQGAAVGELRFQRCRTCGGATHTPAALCAHCAGRDLAWEVSSGLGEVYSWTVVWRPVTPAFEVPYAPIIVDMAEGWRMLSALVDCEHDAVEIGMPVEVLFHPIGEGLALPYFRPRS
jgi:uncharacterized OB-fold protein